MDHLGRKRMDQTQPTIDNIMAVAKRWRAKERLSLAVALLRVLIASCSNLLGCVSKSGGFTTDLTRRAAELSSARDEVRYETRVIMARG
jgi:hypothetical protein